MTDLSNRIVRYGELKPCKTAFIDAHTPGTDQKENFTIIESGQLAYSATIWMERTDILIVV